MISYSNALNALLPLACMLINHICVFANFMAKMSFRPVIHLQIKCDIVKKKLFS